MENLNEIWKKVKNADYEIKKAFYSTIVGVRTKNILEEQNVHLVGISVKKEDIEKDFKENFRSLLMSESEKISMDIRVSIENEKEIDTFFVMRYRPLDNTNLINVYLCKLNGSLIKNPEPKSRKEHIKKYTKTKEIEDIKNWRDVIDLFN